jgi:hypothetical protein
MGHAISHANDEDEATEFAETALWFVETAPTGAEIANITTLASAEIIEIAELIKCKAPMQINRLHRVNLYMFD